MSGHTADSALPLSQGNPCARFFGWTCLFALIALCSGLVDPSLLDPAETTAGKSPANRADQSDGNTGRQIGIGKILLNAGVVEFFDASVRATPVKLRLEQIDARLGNRDGLVGGDDLLARIEQSLQGHGAGDQLALHLEPEEAFGDYQDQLIFLEPRALFPAEIEEGMTFEASALPPGCSRDMPTDALYTVTDIYPDHVVLDGNHPLAGMALRLALTVHSVREARLEEIGQASAGVGFFRLPSSAPGSQLLH